LEALLTPYLFGPAAARCRRACRKACSAAPTTRSGRQGAIISAVAGSSITNVAATVSFSSVPARLAALRLKACPRQGAPHAWRTGWVHDRETLRSLCFEEWTDM